MRHWLQISLAGVVLAVGLVGCGSSSKANGPSPTDADDSIVLGFGHPAGASDARTITALVERYYTAAVAEDGETACALLYPLVAETVVEEYGGVPSLRGSSCTQVMSKLFAQHRRDLTAKRPSLQLEAIRVEGDDALVVLSFSTEVEWRQLSVRLAGSVWKMHSLLDSPLP